MSDSESVPSHLSDEDIANGGEGEESLPIQHEIVTLRHVDPVDENVDLDGFVGVPSNGTGNDIFNVDHIGDILRANEDFDYDAELESPLDPGHRHYMNCKQNLNKGAEDYYIDDPIDHEAEAAKAAKIEAMKVGNTDVSGDNTDTFNQSKTGWVGPTMVKAMSKDRGRSKDSVNSKEGDKNICARMIRLAAKKSKTEGRSASCRRTQGEDTLENEDGEQIYTNIMEHSEEFESEASLSSPTTKKKNKKKKRRKKKPGYVATYMLKTKKKKRESTLEKKPKNETGNISNEEANSSTAVQNESATDVPGDEGNEKGTHDGKGGARSLDSNSPLGKLQQKQQLPNTVVNYLAKLKEQRKRKMPGARMLPRKEIPFSPQLSNPLLHTTNDGFSDLKFDRYGKPLVPTFLRKTFCTLERDFRTRQTELEESFNTNTVTGEASSSTLVGAESTSTTTQAPRRGSSMSRAELASAQKRAEYRAWKYVRQVDGKGDGINRVAIIGAGPVGLWTALLLAREFYQLDNVGISPTASHSIPPANFVSPYAVTFKDGKKENQVQAGSSPSPSGESPTQSHSVLYNNMNKPRMLPKPPMAVRRSYHKDIRISIYERRPEEEHGKRNVLLAFNKQTEGRINKALLHPRIWSPCSQLSTLEAVLLKELDAYPCIKIFFNHSVVEMADAVKGLRGKKAKLEIDDSEEDDENEESTKERKKSKEQAKRDAQEAIRIAENAEAELDPPLAASSDEIGSSDDEICLNKKGYRLRSLSCDSFFLSEQSFVMRKKMMQDSPPTDSKKSDLKAVLSPKRSPSGRPLQADRPQTALSPSRRAEKLRQLARNCKAVFGNLEKEEPPLPEDIAGIDLSLLKRDDEAMSGSNRRRRKRCKIWERPKASKLKERPNGERKSVRLTRILKENNVILVCNGRTPNVDKQRVINPIPVTILSFIKKSEEQTRKERAAVLPPINKDASSSVKEDVGGLSSTSLNPGGILGEVVKQDIGAKSDGRIPLAHPLLVRSPVGASLPKITPSPCAMTSSPKVNGRSSSVEAAISSPTTDAKQRLGSTNPQEESPIKKTLRPSPTDTTSPSSTMSRSRLGKVTTDLNTSNSIYSKGGSILRSNNIFIREFGHQGWVWIIRNEKDYVTKNAVCTRKDCVATTTANPLSPNAGNRTSLRQESAGVAAQDHPEDDQKCVCVADDNSQMEKEGAQIVNGACMGRDNKETAEILNPPQNSPTSQTAQSADSKSRSPKSARTKQPPKPNAPKGMLKYKSFLEIDPNSNIMKALEEAVDYEGDIDVSQTETCHWARGIYDVLIRGKSNADIKNASNAEITDTPAPVLLYLGDAACGKPFYLGTTLQFHIQDVAFLVEGIDWTGRLGWGRFTPYEKRIQDKMRGFAVTAMHAGSTHSVAGNPGSSNQTVNKNAGQNVNSNSPKHVGNQNSPNSPKISTGNQRISPKQNSPKNKSPTDHNKSERKRTRSPVRKRLPWTSYVAEPSSSNDSAHIVALEATYGENKKALQDKRNAVEDKRGANITAFLYENETAQQPAENQEQSVAFINQQPDGTKKVLEQMSIIGECQENTYNAESYDHAFRKFHTMQDFYRRQSASDSDSDNHDYPKHSGTSSRTESVLINPETLRRPATSAFGDGGVTVASLLTGHKLQGTNSQASSHRPSVSSSNSLESRTMMNRTSVQMDNGATAPLIKSVCSKMGEEVHSIPIAALGKIVSEKTFRKILQPLNPK